MSPSEGGYGFPLSYTLTSLGVSLLSAATVFHYCFANDERLPKSDKTSDGHYRWIQKSSSSTSSSTADSTRTSSTKDNTYNSPCLFEDDDSISDSEELPYYEEIEVMPGYVVKVWSSAVTTSSSPSEDGNAVLQEQDSDGDHDGADSGDGPNEDNNRNNDEDEHMSDANNSDDEKTDDDAMNGGGGDGDDGGSPPDHDHGSMQDSSISSIADSDFRALIERNHFDEALDLLRQNPFHACFMDQSTYNVLDHLLNLQERILPLQLISQILQVGGGRAMVSDHRSVGEDTPLHCHVQSLRFLHQTAAHGARTDHNSGLALLLQFYPRGVYVQNENRSTVLDTFTQLWMGLVDRDGTLVQLHDDDEEEDDGHHRSTIAQIRRQLRREFEEATTRDPPPRSVEELSPHVFLGPLFERYAILVRASARCNAQTSREPLAERGLWEPATPMESDGGMTPGRPQVAAAVVAHRDDEAPPQADTPMPSLLHCIACCKCYLAPSFVQLAIAFEGPSNNAPVHDERGRIPLLAMAIISSTYRAGRFLLSALTSAFPDTAQVVDQDQRLPLHVAIDCRLPWESGISVILEAYQGALSVADGKTGLLPFSLAVLGADNDEGNDRLSLSFKLLRSNPLVLSSCRP